MLQNSFVLLEGVRARTEAAIWRQGITAWDEFLDAPRIKGFSQARKERCDERLRDARRRLAAQESAFFTHTLPFPEQWRLWNAFKDEACYLDIETDGYYGSITMVGLCDGCETMQFVRGFNLDRRRLIDLLDRFKLIVTFNGASFDLPVLERYFGFRPTIPHIDLRYVCQRLGLTGGLKAIERTLGIRRRESVDGMEGGDAILLWQLWRGTGDRDYLDRLAAYNEEDILNLKPIADRLIPELWNEVRGAATGESNT
jgi:hypothetical protein